MVPLAVIYPTLLFMSLFFFMALGALLVFSLI